MDGFDPLAVNVSVLSEALPGVPVSTEYPPDFRDGEALGERYVRVWLEGMGGDTFVAMPRVSLECWGESDADAMALAMAAVGALHSAAATHPRLSSSEWETAAGETWQGESYYRTVVNQAINL